MTKEQMFDMKHTLMILFKSTVISFDSKGHGNRYMKENTCTQIENTHNNLGLD